MILVTGAAGFIGASLCEALVEMGHEVIGVDCFYGNYQRWIKEKNLEFIINHPNFIFLEENILNPDITKLIKGLNISHVIHLADIPGVNSCNEENFDQYIQYNIISTQRLLEALKDKGIGRLIYSSSSSVYGENPGTPMAETSNTNPISLYGTTKLAGENICNYYGRVYNIDIVNLRFFTVYGPKQRPDMAFHKFIKSILDGETINLYGDGKQTRDFVYIDDVINAILTAMDIQGKTIVLNVGAGISISVNQALDEIQRILGKRARIRNMDTLFTEQKDTYACINQSQNMLNYNPTVDFSEGLKKQIQYIKRLYRI